MIYDSKFGLALRSMLQEQVRQRYFHGSHMLGVLMERGGVYDRNTVMYGWLEQQYRIGVTI